MTIRWALLGPGRHAERSVVPQMKQAEATELVAVCDADPERAAEIAMEFRCQAFTSLDQLLTKTKLDAAVVSVPTVHHLATARALMEAGIGFVVGSAAGGLVGFVLGWVRKLGDLLEPFVLSLYTLPKIALAPLFVLWLRGAASGRPAE